MRARKLTVTFETGELAGGEPLTMMCELLLEEDGRVVGTGILLADRVEAPFASVGTWRDVIVPTDAEAVERKSGS